MSPHAGCPAETCLACDPGQAVLARFQQQLTTIFIFEPFSIDLQRCGVPTAWADREAVEEELKRREMERPL